MRIVLDVVIGGNTFITESVAKGTRVTVKAQELQFKSYGEIKHHDNV